jgi:hypothetical protein
MATTYPLTKEEISKLYTLNFIRDENSFVEIEELGRVVGTEIAPTSTRGEIEDFLKTNVPKELLPGKYKIVTVNQKKVVKGIGPRPRDMEMIIDKWEAGTQNLAAIYANSARQQYNYYKKVIESQEKTIERLEEHLEIKLDTIITLKATVAAMEGRIKTLTNQKKAQYERIVELETA